MAIYHALSTGEDWRAVVVELDSERLTQRTNFRRGPSDALGRRSISPPWKWPWGKILMGTWEALKLACTSPVSIAPGVMAEATPPSAPPDGISNGRYECDEDRSTRVRQVAKSLGVTTNDLMMAGLFRALGRWGRSHAGISPRALLRLTMPTNLREPEDRRMPAANVMSYAFLDQRAADCDDFAALVQRINVSTRAIRRENLSRQFVEGIALAAGQPWIFRAVLRRNTCMSSAVLSSLGDPASHFPGRVQRDGVTVVAGDLCLEGFYGTPPIRPRTSLCIGLTQYRGRLALNGRADAQILSPAEVDELLFSMVDEIPRFPDAPTLSTALDARRDT